LGQCRQFPNAINPQFLSYRDALYEEDFVYAATVPANTRVSSFYGLYPAGRYQRNAGFRTSGEAHSFGLSFIAYYELSKQLDDYSARTENQDFFNLRNNWALAAYNTPQYFHTQLFL